MRCVMPEVKKCLCCLPLRLGLLGVGYSKLVINFLGTILVIIYSLSDYYKYTCASLQSMFILISVVLFMAFDSFFHVLLVVGSHQKKHKRIRIYYRYNIVRFIVSCFLILAYVVYIVAMPIIYADFYIFSIHEDLVIPFLSSCLMILDLGVQFYLIILVHSEIHRLTTNEKFQLNNQSETYTMTMKDDI